MTTVDWTQLDRSNREHYARQALTKRALALSNAAWNAHGQAVDAAADQAAIERLARVAERTDELYDEIWLAEQKLAGLSEAEYGHYVRRMKEALAWLS